MQVYLFATALGVLGLLSMALLGVSHGIGHHSAGHHTAGQHGAGHAPFGAELLFWLSPRAVFSVLLGAGLSGWLLTALLGHALPLTLSGLVVCLALLGGYLFERFLIRPYWNMLLLFESRPARSLASQTWHRAEAVTDFDAQGCGLVRFEFEGEVRQLLATLTPEERAAGVPVRRGDQVRLEDILENQNRCIVSASLILNLRS